jgi:hypothetical protein
VTPRDPTWQLTGRQRDRYQELLSIADGDALHDLLVRHGPEILDRDLPYLVVAARNQVRSRSRRGAAKYERPSEDVGADAEADSLWDPVARAMAHEGLRELLAELGDLDPRDVMVLWSHAAGRTDHEIAAEWDKLGFKPRGPSLESIRTRRARARTLLRQRLRRKDHGS